MKNNTNPKENKHMKDTKLPMFSRSGKSTTSQYLVFREDSKWNMPQRDEDEDKLDSISENAFDESDFEVKIRSIDHDIDGND